MSSSDDPTRAAANDLAQFDDTVTFQILVAASKQSLGIVSGRDFYGIGHALALVDDNDADANQLWYFETATQRIRSRASGEVLAWCSHSDTNQVGACDPNSSPGFTSPTNQWLLTQGRLFLQVTFHTPDLEGDVVLTGSDITIKLPSDSDETQVWNVEPIDDSKAA